MTQMGLGLQIGLGVQRRREAGAGITDALAPTVTSSASASVAENAALAHALTADESVTWSIVGGADQAQFELSGSTLRWAANGTQNFEAPADANTDNAYIVTVRATDAALNTADQTITVTVTDEDEWSTTFEHTGWTGNSNAWNGANLRQQFAASVLSASGDKVRLTLRSSSVAEGAKVAAMYIGHAAGAGDAWDFDGTQVQVTVGGATSWTIPANSTVLTDAITYAFDEAKSFIVAAFFDDSANDNLRSSSGLANTNAYSKTAASEVSTSNVTGYSNGGGLRMIEKIEVAN